MRKTAVIINPKSGRGNGKGQKLAEALKSTQTENLYVLQRFEELYPALQRFAIMGVEDLFISSGDGTVQAIQTWIAEEKAFAKLPRLCLLPHGTTNMTAADLGFQRRRIAEQVDFITAPNLTQTKRRHTVRAVNPKGGKPQHGMFFGTGAVSEATRYCQNIFNNKGVHGSFATFAMLASVAGKTILSKPNPDDPNRFDKPYRITLTADGQRLCDGQQLLMLATTLDKLILGSRPFWGGASAAMRLTVMPYPVPSFVRWLLPLMYGSEHRTAPPGAISKAAHACEVECKTDFVLDGEFYQPPDHGPLLLETGPDFEYIIA
jgi:diacylglycerol kinase (ATP)